MSDNRQTERGVLPPDADGVVRLRGERVEYSGAGELPAPGAYWKSGDIWYARTPAGLLGNLANHAVTEHDDGTITVSPSILISAPHRSFGPTSWHGFLERGIWRAC